MITSKIAPIFIFTIFIFMMTLIAFKGFLIFDSFNSNKELYVIKVPTYDGNYITYFTENYVEENGCVKFVDEMKFQQNICTNYMITKLK
jgi:hypothetical protein